MSGGVLRRARETPDVVVLAVVWLLAAAIGFARKDFTGDGLRHLPPILASARPHLGEPRWLLFPGLLFVLLRPLVSLGLVTTVEGLTKPATAATLLAAGIYLVALRACLVALRIAPARRAAGLAVAGASAGFFYVATDLMEPMFAAATVVAGLAFVARRAGSGEESEAQRRRAILIGVAMIAAASLFYQGVILGVGLIPLCAPRASLRDRKTLLGAAAILLLVPLVTTGALVLAGNSLGHAFARFAQGEENAAYRSYLKKSGLSAYLVALLAGPPQGLLTAPEFHGFNALVAALRDPAQRRWALELAARFGFGDLVIAGGLWAAFRRRDFALLVAFASLMVLPLVRHQQYGYLKYYILFPVVLAAGASRVSPRVAGAVAAVLVLANVVPLVPRVAAQRRFYAERVAAYAQADARTCWLTTAWAPYVGFRWPGTVCPLLGTLAGGSGEDAGDVAAQSRAALTACLRACFCDSSAVFTDDMLEGAAGVVEENARHFGYTDVDVTRLVIPAARARLVSPSAGVPVYAYPPDEQRRLCGVVTDRSGALR